tara:strand:- start:298 stop:531 length:234 start_codon:yes stop_codon:yes gene_type:complete
MGDDFVKTDNPDFVKDQSTGALVSTDISAFNRHKMQQKQLEESKNQKNDLNNIKSEVTELKNEISEIKELLQQLLTR